MLGCTGVESEAELPFAVLQSLLSGAMGAPARHSRPSGGGVAGGAGAGRAGGRQPLPGRPGHGVAAGGAGRGRAGAVPGGRRPVAGPALGRGAGVRRPPAGGRRCSCCSSARGNPTAGRCRTGAQAAGSDGCRTLLAEHAPDLPPVRDRVLAEADGNPACSNCPRPTTATRRTSRCRTACRTPTSGASPSCPRRPVKPSWSRQRKVARWRPRCGPWPVSGWRRTRWRRPRARG